MTRRVHLLVLAQAFLLASCGPPKPAAPSAAEILRLSWQEIETRAKGQTVTLLMWTGDPLINRYMQSWVVPELKKQHDVTLNIVASQGNDLVSFLTTEMEAGKKISEWDLTWINGETFYQLRQINALFGPFTDKLPNAQFIDFENPFIRYDFQQEVNGYECPWGNVQLALIYDSKRVPEPPKNREQLLAWVKAHPGRFTWDNSFTGMTFLKGLLYDLAGGPQSLSGKFDGAKYTAESAKLWAYLRELKPYLWREGKTFPESVAAMHQLLANGETDFSMSNNDAEVDNKVRQGFLPDTCRAYALDSGTIQNSHYMGIIRHSGHQAAAMVVCNFLISPAAQFEKYKPSVWGDGTILDIAKLPPDWREKFTSAPERKLAPKRADLQPKALMEPDPQYMVRLFADFRKEIIEK
ncbi:MAG: ABC transporter substrate-binding protein [Verrucomicrobiota bacterium]